MFSFGLPALPEGSTDSGGVVAPSSSGDYPATYPSTYSTQYASNYTPYSPYAPSPSYSPSYTPYIAPSYSPIAPSGGGEVSGSTSSGGGGGESAPAAGGGSGGYTARGRPFGERGAYVELDYPEMRFLRAGENPTELLSEVRRQQAGKAQPNLTQLLVIGLVALALLK